MLSKWFFLLVALALIARSFLPLQLPAVTTLLRDHFAVTTTPFLDEEDFRDDDTRWRVLSFQKPHR